MNNDDLDSNMVTENYKPMSMASKSMASTNLQNLGYTPIP